MFLVSFAGVNYRRRCLARLRLRFSCFARFKTSPFATCPLGCRPCARPLTFAVVVFVRTLPSLTGNRCGHPCLRPSTRPLVMLDLILFRHCGHVYVCFSPALATTLPSFTVNWCNAPLLAAVDASIRHAGLDRLPTVRTAVCVLRTVACDDFTIFHREPVYAPLLAADLSIGDAGSDPFLTVWTRVRVLLTFACNDCSIFHRELVVCTLACGHRRGHSSR